MSWSRANRFAVLAYHFPFPGLGHLRKDRAGYGWLPTELERALPPETTALFDQHSS